MREGNYNTMKEIKSKSFANGKVYLLHTHDSYPVEVTDTFLPIATKHAVSRHQNALTSYDVGDRTERWMVGVSVSSSCPVRCKFCATGNLKRFRNLSAGEIVEQVEFIVNKNQEFNPTSSKEFKVNYTRMGDFGLNTEAVKEAIEKITAKYPNTHHYVSTIGIVGVDYSWIKGNITLQVSLHSLREETRNALIPFSRKLTIEQLGQIRTNSNLKTTVNLTLVDEKDFDIVELKKYFDPKYFFIKISPLNENNISEKNGLEGVIVADNLV